MPYWVLTMLRSIFLLLLAFVLIRLSRKKSTTPMTHFEYITGIVIGVSIALLALDQVPNAVNGIIVLGVWITLPAVIYYLSVNYITVRDLVRVKETVLINHGIYW